MPFKRCDSPSYRGCVENLLFNIDEAATHARNAAAYPLPQAYEAVHTALESIVNLERDALWLLSRNNDTLDIASHIGKDFELLCRASKDERWSASTPVLREFFAIRSNFSDIGERERARGDLLTILPAVNDQLVEYLARHPEKIYNLNPRSFEELVAEIFDGFGFDVELTSQTRDGGYDIIAVEKRLSKSKLLIECKRYGPLKTVGIAAVQRLHGVTQATDSTKGLLVTTAPRFTRPAEEFIEQHCWHLEGHSYKDIVSWLHLYQSTKMRRVYDSFSGGAAV